MGVLFRDGFDVVADRRLLHSAWQGRASSIRLDTPERHLAIVREVLPCDDCNAEHQRTNCPVCGGESMAVPHFPGEHATCAVCSAALVLIVDEGIYTIPLAGSGITVAICSTEQDMMIQGDDCGKDL